MEWDPQASLKKLQRREEQAASCQPNDSHRLGGIFFQAYLDQEDKQGC